MNSEPRLYYGEVCVSGRVKKQACQSCDLRTSTSMPHAYQVDIIVKVHLLQNLCTYTM